MNAESKLSPKLLAGFGKSVEEKIIRELKATPSDRFSELQNIKNLAGDNTGYVRVYDADKMDKLTFMSVNVMPGGRYFNIHLHPEPQYRIPRFGFEGMITVHGSQVSMDFYPDMDLVMHIREFLDQCGALTAIYDEAKKSGLPIQPSRLPHMRAFCSPYFLNSVGTTAEQLPRVEEVAHQYLDVWLQIVGTAPQVSKVEAADRANRRSHFAETIIEMDPDREMIVKVYGQETTDAIEDAMMRV